MKTLNNWRVLTKGQEISDKLIDQVREEFRELLYNSKFNLDYAELREHPDYFSPVVKFQVTYEDKHYSSEHLAELQVNYLFDLLIFKMMITKVKHE